MTIEHITIQGRPHPFAGRGVIDPVGAYLHDIRPGVGRITIVQWGRAWTAQFSAMGKQANGAHSTIRQFLPGAGSGYLAGKLTLLPGQVTARQLKQDESRLLIICELICDALRRPTGVEA